MTARKHQITKNPTTGAQPKTTTAGDIVEKLEAWMLTQQISVDEITKFNALIDSLKGPNRLQIVICFIDYLESATIYRSIWIQQIAGLMKEIDRGLAADKFADRQFKITVDAREWFRRQHELRQTKFDTAVDSWSQKPLVGGLFGSLKAIQTANTAYLSHGSDLPAALTDFVRKVREENERDLNRTYIKVPEPVELLVRIIDSGRCDFAGLGDPLQGMLVWPISKDWFQDLLGISGAKTYLSSEHKKTVGEKIIRSSYEKEFPGQRSKSDGKFERKNLDVLVHKNVFVHGNKKPRK
jgi:hypothetical protein